jgi:5-methylcytosine-specific restriction endonuclease McrA
MNDSQRAREASAYTALTDEDVAMIVQAIRGVLEDVLESCGLRKKEIGPLHRTRRYRANLRAARGHHTSAQWQARVEVYGCKCAYCGCPLTSETLVKDHAIPLSRGGTNWPSNLMPACKPCNSRKKDKTPLEDGWRFF